MIIILIALTSIVSFLAFSRNDLFDKLQFNAWYIKHYKEWYRFFSYALLHADWAHLIINMFVLWSFSSIVLSHFTIIYHGAAGLHFLLLYVGGTIFSTLYDFWKIRKIYITMQLALPELYRQWCLQALYFIQTEKYFSISYQ